MGGLPDYVRVQLSDRLDEAVEYVCELPESDCQFQLATSFRLGERPAALLVGAVPEQPLVLRANG